MLILNNSNHLDASSYDLEQDKSILTDTQCCVSMVRKRSGVRIPLKAPRSKTKVIRRKYLQNSRRIERCGGFILWLFPAKGNGHKQNYHSSTLHISRTVAWQV